MCYYCNKIKRQIKNTYLLIYHNKYMNRIQNGTKSYLRLSHAYVLLSVKHIRRVLIALNK